MLLLSLTRRIPIFFFTVIIALFATGCDILQETFRQPTLRSFPSLTPLPTQTFTITPTATLTNTATPTSVTPVAGSTPLSLSPQPIIPENANNLALFASFGKGVPQQMAVSPDGSFLAISTTHGVYLYDAGSLRLLESWVTNDIQHSLVFSPEGQVLASGNSRGEITIWNIEDGNRLTFPGNQPVLALAYDTGGKRLASSGWDGMVRVWQVETGKLLHSFPAHLRVVKSLAFSPDDELLYGWALNESVQVWRLSDGRSMPDIYIGRDELGKNPYGGVFSQDGTVFAANHGLRMRVFRTRNGTTMWLIRDIESPLQQMTLSHSGRFLAAEEQNTIKIWDLETGEQFAQIKLPPSQAERHLLAFTPDEGTLITLSNTLMRWVIPPTSEAITSVEKPQIEGGQEFTGSILLDFEAFENTLYLAAWKGQINTFDVSTGKLKDLFPATGNVILSFAVSPESSIFAFGHPDGKISVIDENNQLIFDLDAHNGPVRSLAFSLDGEHFASGGEDRQLLVWQTNDGSLEERFELSSTPQELFFLSEDELLARTPDMASLWSLGDSAVQQTFPGFSFAVSADGRLLAAASQNPGGDVVDLYRLPTGGHLASVPLEGNQLALSPDHALLATAGEDLMLWRTEDGRLIKVLSDINLFGKIRFSYDGSWLILATWDGTLRLWSVPLK